MREMGAEQLYIDRLKPRVSFGSRAPLNCAAHVVADRLN
jgi:hypothetical protein